MFNKKTPVRKSSPEKQQREIEDKKSKGKEHHRTSSRKLNSSKRSTTSPKAGKHTQFVANHKPSARNVELEACSSFPKNTINCCAEEKVTGVSIKDVGLDIAGFLIEEEIKQNKEKLKLEIIRQIALSRELDKHLERQRYIMNTYICKNASEGAANEFCSQNDNDFIAKCNCQVCQEATRKSISATSTSKCVEKSDVSVKSVQVNKADHTNSFTQSSPLTKDVSCQDMCQQCNTINENEETEDCRSAVNVQFKCTPFQSPEPDISAQPVAESVTNVRPKPAVVNKMAVAVYGVPTKIKKLDKIDQQKAVTIEMADQTLNNLNNLLNTPLNTIEPQTTFQQNSQEDTTEMILCNIKSIVRDYMDNMSLTCNKCKLEPSTSKEENKSSRSNSDEFNNLSPVSVKKSNMSTRCENNGTHIDIIMQFCESNKKKKAILEIQPCFDEQKCIKYTKTNCSSKKICEDMDMCNLSSCSIINSSRKFSPYPIKDRTFRKSSKPNIACRSDKGENYCKQKKCPKLKAQRKTSNCSVTSGSSNHSIEIIKVNRCCKIPTVCESSSSDSTEVISNNRKICCNSKKSDSKRHHHKKGLSCCRNKSIICTYATNFGSNSNESKQSRKYSREQKYLTTHFNPVKKQHKSSRKLDHGSHKSKIKNVNPVTTKKKIKRGRTVASSSSLESSNLDETSYREIQMCEKSKLHSRKMSKSRIAFNTCSSISLNLKGSNVDILQDCSKKKNETTLHAYETLTSSKRPRDTTLLKKTRKQRLRKSVKNCKNVAFERKCMLHVSSSSDSLIDKPKRIPKRRNKFRIGKKLRPAKPESDSLGETLPDENVKSFTKISPEESVVIVSPIFETKIQLMQNWLSYIHNLQAKDNVNTIAPPMVAINLPTSSNYVLSNEDSNQQLEYLLTTKTVLSNQFFEKNFTNILKESVFEKFKPNSTAEKFNENDNKRTVFEIRDSSNWAILKKGKNEIALDDSLKRTIIKQNNQNNGLDCNKSKSEMLYTESYSSSDNNIIGSSQSDYSFDTTYESILDFNENNHDELITELICPNRKSLKGKYFDVNETDTIINRAFYIQDIFVKLAGTEHEKEYWRDTVLRAMKNIVTKTS